MSMVEKVAEFHQTFGVEIKDQPAIPNWRVKELRIALITEEYKELIKAIENDNIVEIADGICDLHYVVSGTSLAYGLNEDKLFAEVHRSNMSKATADGKVLKREDGKILKAETWTPPNLKRIIFGA